MWIFPANADIAGPFGQWLSATGDGPVARLKGPVSAAAAMKASTEGMDAFARQHRLLFKALSRQMETIATAHPERTKEIAEQAVSVSSALSAMAPEALRDEWQVYLKDTQQRMVMTLDTLRERGDIFIEHEAAGCPPVLTYEYEIILDGASLPRPCNYVLLRIVPPEDIQIDETRRPYVIIDPRAGHGAGVGGFKTDSQVGVALKGGHPVYFVAFGKDPVEDQTLADVTRAEAEFVREVSRRHPDSPKPIVVGNCQGGWATLILAATNPDITGPIVLNGSPVAPWSGEVGTNPMRYNGGIFGGVWQPMLWSDIGAGKFDGANLVLNFEMLNPSRNWFGKYYDLYSRIDTEGPRFLEFEKWWGGFFLLNEAEIAWIVNQLFVGNRLVRNEAHLEPGRSIDVKNIQAPIIVFASHGDNITPPQQALNWIVDSYADVSEIQIRGQRIVYMIHEQVGHLGIFVSSKIAKKEHSEVVSTIETIEALAPGLYEMKIDEHSGEGLHKSFLVSFHERSLEDLRQIDPDRDDEAAFAAVARNSELQGELYDLFVRPAVRAFVNEQTAETIRKAHPLRLQREALSSQNPLMRQVQTLAEKAKEEREPAREDNLFVRSERLWASALEQSMDAMRDLRDMWFEAAFFTLWGTPAARAFGSNHLPGRTLKNEAELRGLPEVRLALGRIEEGGFAEAVIRMLLLLAESRGSVRRDRLERSARVLTRDEPFRSLGAERRALMIREQTLITEFEKEQAIAALPALLPAQQDRELAMKVVQYIPGAIDEMAPHTLEMLQRLRHTLGLPPATTDVTEDPLASAESGQQPVQASAAE